MDIREFYSGIGVDYEVVLKRLLGREEMVKKFLKKFLDDGTFAELESAMAEQDYDQILVKAHTLKGISSNLDIKPVFDASTEIVRCVRENEREKIAPIFEKLKEDYRRVTKELSEIV